MSDNELLDYLPEQIESVAETLQLLQKDEDCNKRIKKVLTNQISMLTFCQKEVEAIAVILNTLKKSLDKDIKIDIN